MLDTATLYPLAGYSDTLDAAMSALEFLALILTVVYLGDVLFEGLCQRFCNRVLHSILKCGECLLHGQLTSKANLRTTLVSPATFGPSTFNSPNPLFVRPAVVGSPRVRGERPLRVRR